MRCPAILATLLATAGLTAAKPCVRQTCQRNPCAQALQIAGVEDRASDVRLDCVDAQVVLVTSTTTVLETAFSDVPTLTDTQTATVTADPATSTTTVVVTSTQTLTSVATQPEAITSVLKRGTNGTQSTAAPAVAPTGVPGYLTSACPALSDYISACGCFSVWASLSTVTSTATSTSTAAATATVSTTAIANTTTTPPAVTVTATSTAVVTTTTSLSRFQLRSVPSGNSDAGAVYVADLVARPASETIFQATADASRALTCELRAGGRLRCGAFTAAQQGQDSAFRGISDARWATVGTNVRPVVCEVGNDGVLVCVGWEQQPRRVEFSYPTTPGRRPDLYLGPAGSAGSGRTVVQFQVVPVPLAQPI